MLSNVCSQKSDIARLLVIGIIKTKFGLEVFPNFFSCVYEGCPESFETVLIS